MIKDTWSEESTEREKSFLDWISYMTRSQTNCIHLTGRHSMNTKGTIKVGVTNAWTGKAEYKDGMKLDKKCTMLRATCAIPFVFPTIKVDGKPYYDGGIADPIPIRRSIEDGNEKNLIKLTRPEGIEKELSKSNKAAAKLLRKYPHLPELLLNRIR